MSHGDNVYKGFKCIKCGLWFCRNYLFEQHNRRLHNHLGDFIVLPALSAETLLYLNETQATPFAIMHIPDSENELLMRLTNVETHCMAEIATTADLLQLRTKQDEEAVEIVIVLDIYPNRERTGTVSYGVVSRINAKLLQTNSFSNPPQPLSHGPMGQSTNGFGYNPALHLRTPLTDNYHSLDAGTHIQNPYCDELERLASLL